MTDSVPEAYLSDLADLVDLATNQGVAVIWRDDNSFRSTDTSIAM